MSAAAGTADLLARWQAAWAEALAHWSKYTRLHDPRLCRSSVEASKEGLTGSFAMIRLADKSVVIDLQKVHDTGLDDHAVEILAHEIGHHVLAPATAIDHFRLLARIRRGLPTLEAHAPLIANLFTDLLINDRLQRQAGLRMAEVYEAIHRRQGGAGNGKLWSLYMGIYESLWGLKRGAIGGPVDDDRILADAWLGARLVRVYGRDWLVGSSRFSALVLPYLVDDANAVGKAAALLHDTQEAGEGSEPAGISDFDPGELEDSIHPSADPAITGEDSSGKPLPPNPDGPGGSRGQRREPFEFGEILRAAGVKLSDTEIAARYYREQALPHLVRFPVREQSRSTEPQIEGVEPWDIGDPFDQIDWMQTLIQSPTPVPGLTTLRRVYGEEPGSDVQVEPVDLDLYVDSSGSMPNPQQQVSYLTLAGAIIALSALKVGARVQATLWSGKNQLMCTDGFVRDEKAVLAILTGFYGGGTAFPIHKMRDTYAGRTRDARAVHILVISDDGVSTMFDADERGNSGWDVSAAALAAARGGGTMALNLWEGYKPEWIGRATEQGWAIERVRDFAELIEFARKFSRRHYAAPVKGLAA